MLEHINTPPPLAYDVQGLMRVSGWGRSKIQTEIAEGRLKARKSAGKLFVLHDDAMEWLRAFPVREPSKREAA